MSGDNVFGAGHDRAPGITPVPGALPPQFTEFMVESAVMHSRSQGWQPCVVIRSATDDGAGLVGSMEVNAAYWEWVDSLITAGERAPLDLEAALQPGGYLA